MEVSGDKFAAGVRQSHSPGQAGGQLVLPGVDVLQEAVEVGDAAGVVQLAGKLDRCIQFVRGVHLQDHHFRCGELRIVTVQWFRQVVSLQ